jgi:hypothetical protein
MRNSTFATDALQLVGGRALDGIVLRPGRRGVSRTMPSVIMLMTLPLFMIVVKPDSPRHGLRLDTGQHLEEIRQAAD